MTDIVERLTTLQDHYSTSGQLGPENRNIFAEAASEIGRLRTALKEIQAYSVGDRRPRHTWYYDRAEAALNQQIGEET